MSPITRDREGARLKMAYEQNAGNLACAAGNSLISRRLECR